MKVQSFVKILFFMVLPFVSGCIPVVLGGGFIATTMIADKRSADVYVEDNWVALKIRSYYARSEGVRVGNINVSVYNGKVLLTGAASSQEEVKKAVSIAKATRGVLGVHSELKVQSESASELAADAFLSNQIKIQLLTDKRIRGLDIHVETTKSVVYLTGEVPTIAERDQAVDIVRQVPNVHEVVSYIDVK